MFLLDVLTVNLLFCKTGLVFGVLRTRLNGPGFVAESCQLHPCWGWNRNCPDAQFSADCAVLGGDRALEAGIYVGEVGHRGGWAVLKVIPGLCPCLAFFPVYHKESSLCHTFLTPQCSAHTYIHYALNHLKPRAKVNSSS